MKVTLVQTSSIDDKDRNLVQAEELIRAAIQDTSPDLVALPELFSYLGGSAAGAAAAAETPPGPAYSLLSGLAREYGVNIHGGSMAERADGRLFNTSFVFDRRGQPIGSYRKIHMFDVDTPDGQSYRESATYTPGDQLVTVPIDGVPTGCAICYDLRFGELFVALANAGARIIVLPAAFTMMTGKDHWEPLLRARAIETQCYVLAPAQTGSYMADGVERLTYGNSMIVDPWGAVIARAQDTTGWVSARLDFAYQDEVRRRVPSNRNRRLGSAAPAIVQVEM